MDWLTIMCVLKFMTLVEEGRSVDRRRRVKLVIVEGGDLPLLDTRCPITRSLCPYLVDSDGST